MAGMTISEATYAELFDRFEEWTTVVLAIDAKKEKEEWEYVVKNDNEKSGFDEGHIAKGYGARSEIITFSNDGETREEFLNRFKQEHDHDQEKTYVVYTLGQTECVMQVIE